MSLIDQIFEPGQARVLSGPRVLLVDDESALRELMGIRLESVGFDVDEAADGYEALKKLKLSHYDAIVMDTNMPGMFGYEVCSAVREIPLGKNLAILGMSGNEIVDYKSNWTEAGADGFVYKPDINVTPYILEKSINSAVALRKGI